MSLFLYDHGAILNVDSAGARELVSGVQLPGPWIDCGRFMLRAISRRLKHLTTAFVLLIVSVLVAEGVLNIFVPRPPSFVTDCADVDFQSMLVPSATTHHELQRLARQQFGEGPEFQTNSLGLRGPEPDAAAAADQIRVLVLGDETVLCPDQPDDHTLGMRLKQFLESATGQVVEVINAGVPGYSPLLSWIQFQHELKALAPDIVVLHFDMTDIEDDSVYRRLVKESEGRQICPNVALRESPAPANAVLQGLKNSSLVRKLTDLTGLQSSRTSDLTDRYAWTVDARQDLRLVIQHALSPLESFRDNAAESDFRFLVTTAPVPWQVTKSDEFPTLRRMMTSAGDWPVTKDRSFQILDAACQQQAIPLCDATPAFREFSQPAKLFQPDSVRLSAYGNALYAREISAKLLQTPELAVVFSDRSHVSAEPTHLH